MTKPAGGGESDKLRAFTEDPELRALMERLQAAPAGEAQPILEAFVAKAYSLHPDWRETLEAAESDGSIVHALFIHSLKEARARPELTDLDRLEIAELEAEFVMRFDIFSVTAPVSAAAQGAIRLASIVQRMTLIASVGPEEAERIRRQARRDNAARAGSTEKAEKAWVAPAMRSAWRLLKRNPNMTSQSAARIIKDAMGEDCPDVRWVAQMIRDKRPGWKLSPQLASRRKKARRR